ncbi:ATP-binding protein [Candidatus Thiosymbion oneisti]|uniref:ATP-binding protein n=1 Tax=Candidatus Thiosymbion oneisti TaxID=589554 RepID=UPI000B7E1D7E|nr:ATP-binding protein [Candidatus Thiosymbion oneisti]
MSSTRRSIPLKQRIVTGVVTKPDVGAVNLHLPDCAWADHARIPAEYLPPGRAPTEYQKGKPLSVFLLNPLSDGDDARFYMANALWAEEEQNPWFIDPPRTGQMRVGMAVRYFETDGVFVRLDGTQGQAGGIEALLSVSETPGNHRDIADAIDLGDRLVVVISQVRPEILTVYLSVKLALSMLTDEERLRRQRNRDKPMVTVLERQAWGRPVVSQGRTPMQVGVLGPDPYFSDHLRLWLESWGIAAVKVDDASHLARILEAGNRPSHLVLAAHSWPTQISEGNQLRTRIQQTDTQLVWLDDETERGPPITCPRLPLPVHLADLVATLQGADRAVRPRKTRGTHRFTDFQRNRVQELADRLLDEICTENDGTLAALWVARERPGVYSIRAQSGLDDQALEHVKVSLGQTLLASAVEQNRFASQAVINSGPLRPLAPAAADRVWCMPVPYTPPGEEQAVVERAVAFFYRHRDTKQPPEETLPRYLPRMQLLVEMLHFAIHNETLAVLADLGRHSAGYLHEIAQLAEPIAGELSRLSEAQADDKALPPHALRRIGRQTDRLVGLARSDLGAVRLTRDPRLPVRATLEEAIRLFAYRFNNIDCDLELRVPNLPLTISLPPMVLEQALRNLLDNASHFLRDMGGRARVQVQTRLAPEDRDTPLHVDVEDNGPGVRAGMLGVLFHPRHTDKGEEGTGMGLYLARNLLRGFGGELELVDSIRWRHTCFRIRLPVVLNTMAREKTR